MRRAVTVRPRGTSPARATVLAAAVLAATVITTALPALAHACPVCFGDADSGTSRGLQTAIVFMLGATGLVGGGVLAFVLRLRHLSRRRHR